MAGGKVSPRQKMINMMYLVLTALLAMNVSAEILLSFQTIANSLRISAEKLDGKNDDLGEAIKAAVDKEMSGGNRKNERLKLLVEDIRKKTNESIGGLEGHVQKMRTEAVAGWDPVNKSLKNLSETEKNYRYWMFNEAGGKDLDNGGRGAGKAKEMKDKLQEYVNWANEKYIELNSTKDKPFNPSHKQFKYICVDPKEDSTIASTSEIKTKSWEYYTFHSAPAIANVAIVEKLKNDVRVIESDLLEIVKSKLSDIDFKPGELIAMEAPSAKVVVAGMKFESSIFVGMKANTDFKPSATGPNLKPDTKTGGWTISTTADAKFIPAGKSEGEQSYTASITVAKTDGSKKTLPIKGTFRVRKPEIVVKAESITIMYRDCANDIEVDVPALESLYDPDFEITGGKLQQSEKSKKKLRVVPESNKVVITVNQKSNGGKFKLGTLDYKVIPPPKPKIAMYLGGKEYTNQPIGTAQKIKIAIEADASFAKQLPHDARYQIEGLTIFRKEGLGAAKPIETKGSSKPDEKTSITFDLLAAWPNPKKGEVMYIEIKDISRVNYANKHIKEDIGQREKTITGNMSGTTN